MSYLVLARKWRPQVFEDISGQDFIVRALKNAVKTNKVAHAMIFSGPRGVGKTSAARILAKALNCSNAKSVGVPCSECPDCVDILSGKSLDVIEIDAASHTGVNDIREIIENIKYLPSTPDKTKIYIIDEAHMLSQSAFNALLKTLEEPPTRVLFILATTELHKVPSTILSRCQRYDFHEIPAAVIKERMEAITSEEGIKISGETLQIIAEEADGSIRDALSLLDQLLATFGTEIGFEDAAGLIGITDGALLNETLVSILNKDAKRALEILSEVFAKGLSPKRFAEDILKSLRNSLILKICGRDALLDVSDERAKALEAILSSTAPETLEALFKLMLESTEEVHKSFYPRMALEAALVRLTLVSDVVSLDEILQRVEKISSSDEASDRGSGQAQTSELEDRYSGQLGLGMGAPAQTKSSKINDTEAALDRESVAEFVPDGGSDVDKAAGKNAEAMSKGSFIEYVREYKPIIAEHLENASTVDDTGHRLVVEFLTESIHSIDLKRSARIGALEKLAEEFFRKKLRIDIAIKPLRGSDSPSDPNGPTESIDEAEDQAPDELVEQALKLFGGRVIKKRKNKE